jgi:hypothetical protein
MIRAATAWHAATSMTNAATNEPKPGLVAAARIGIARAAQAGAGTLEPSEAATGRHAKGGGTEADATIQARAPLHHTRLKTSSRCSCEGEEQIEADSRHDYYTDDPKVEITLRLPYTACSHFLIPPRNHNSG